MYLLVTYDVCTETAEGARRLRQVAKCCMDFGRRVQNSVFECKITESDYVKMKARIMSIIDSEKDSIRIYNLTKNYATKIEHYGKETTFNIDDALII